MAFIIANWLVIWHSDDPNVGTHSVTVQVADSSGVTHTRTFLLTVNNVNDAPVFDFTPPSSTSEDVAFSYQLTASDIDANVVNETLTYTGLNTPSWLTVSSSGLLTGTPTNNDVGTHSVTVQVADNAGTTDTKTFILTVLNTNDPPLIEVADLPAKEGDIHEFDEGDVIKFALEVSDDDLRNGDSFKYEVISDQDVSWLGLDSYGDEAIYPDVATIEVTANDAEVGEYQVAFKVTDFCWCNAY